jgi:hypothetical protein
MQLARRFEGKKFMWDGKVYPLKEQAQEAAQQYESNGFLVRMVEEGGEFYLFTRKEVKEVPVAEQV